MTTPTTLPRVLLTLQLILAAVMVSLPGANAITGKYSSPPLFRRSPLITLSRMREDMRRGSFPGRRL